MENSKSETISELGSLCARYLEERQVMEYKLNETKSELSFLKGKIDAVKALVLTEYNNVPGIVLAEIFGWKLERKNDE